MANLEAELHFDDFEIHRLGPSIESFSLNAPTKMSPISWVHESRELAFFIDIGIRRKTLSRSKAKVKIAVLLEPLAWTRGVARAAVALRTNFDAVLTFDEGLLSLGDPFVPYIPGGIQLKPENVIPTPEKVNLISMSASSKKQLPGHIIRHEIAERFQSNPDLQLMGRGFNPYDDPNCPFSTFAYSIAVENSRMDCNVTEKVLQCMLNMCVPIYWGGALGPMGFNEKGFIAFNSVDELPGIFDSISMDDYEARREALEENFIVAQKYISKEVNLLRSLARVPGLERYADLTEHNSPITFDLPIEPGRESYEKKVLSTLSARLLRQWRYHFQFFWHFRSRMIVSKSLTHGEING